MGRVVVVVVVVVDEVVVDMVVWADVEAMVAVVVVGAVSLTEHATMTTASIRTDAANRRVMYRIYRYRLSIPHSLGHSVVGGNGSGCVDVLILWPS